MSWNVGEEAVIRGESFGQVTSIDRWSGGDTVYVTSTGERVACMAGSIFASLRTVDLYGRWSRHQV